MLSYTHDTLLFTVADIRELISLDDVAEDEELKFGPNGGLVFCFEYDVHSAQLPA